MRVTSQIMTCQSNSILGKMSNHYNYEDTIGYCSGVFSDTTDPDSEVQEENVGFLRRQAKYCSQGDVPKAVPLQE